MNAGTLAGLIKGVRYPRAEVTGGCELSLWVLGRNSGLPEQQRSLLLNHLSIPLLCVF